MRYLSLTAVLACAMLFTVNANAQAIDDTQTQEEITNEAQALIDFWQAMNPEQGKIRIDAANVVLDVPDSYIFLNAKDAESVLVDAWGNMPGSNALGMLMPAGVTPFDRNAWAVTIEYQEDGYVSDEEAEEIDYSELLSEMQSDTLEASKNRIEQGYADFKPDTDNYAAYGLGALITGKVLAKTGFLAMLIIFLKKFGVFIVIGIGALLKGFFSRKSKQDNKD